jgi:aminoglycoside 6'-N-acetyltransferase I
MHAIERCISPAQRGWLELRRALWPDCTEADHATDRDAYVSRPERQVALVAYGEDNKPIGFIEVSLRSDYVNGTSSSPVAFIEGLYVVEQARGRGVGRALVQSGERWAREHGCREMASDVLLDNESGHAAHRALGFEETDRVVYFRKGL